MRALPTAVCAAFLVTSSLLAAEQSAPKARSKSTYSHALRHHAVHHSHRKTSRTNQASGKNVVIYNGNQKQTHVFNASTDPMAPAHNLAPAVIRIADAGSKTDPVVVGISTDAGSKNQPVVVNIASGGSSAQPVVLGVASSGFQTAGSVGPAAVAVSPRPAKRPPYRPAALDR